jgi:rsbT co-antagonist protein RsbR
LNPIGAISAHLIHKKKQVGSEIIADITKRLDISVEGDEIEASMIDFPILVGVMGKSLVSSNEEIYSELIKWSHAAGERNIGRGKRISQSLELFPAIRTVFIRYIGQLSITNKASAEEIVFIAERINYILDVAMNETIKVHDHFKDRIISAAYEEVSELSAPIVPILKGVAVLPLIGSIDSHKANHILNNVIPKVADLKLECLIIDFSGIHVIDTMVTDHIFKIHRILRLLGIQAMLTGVRPTLAQTAVGIGIDFSSIKTYATVQQALESIRR